MLAQSKNFFIPTPFIPRFKSIPTLPPSYSPRLNPKEIPLNPPLQKGETGWGYKLRDKPKMMLGG